MKQVRVNCPACGTAKFQYSRRALISPWIREIAKIRQRSCAYRICDSCDSGFCTLTYSASELDLIYGDYRGSAYQQIRSSWEATYTENLNASLDKGEAHFHHRINQLEILVKRVNSNLPLSTESVLDIGGGHGSLIPNWDNLKQKVVMDVSNSELVEGVTRVKSWADFHSPVKFDLVLVCMVLEHLNDPLSFLVDLRENFLRHVDDPKSTLFYFEVPSGIPVRPRFRFRWMLTWLASLSRITWKYVDQRSVLRPQRFPMRIAEHIQFYSISGLKRLLIRSGFEILEEEDYKVTEGLKDSKGVRIFESHAVVARVLVST